MTMSVPVPKALPQANGDFYAISSTLSEEDQALLRRARAFLEAEVAPIINQYWIREEFPHQILPKLAELHIMGLAYQGYSCPGKSSLLDGMMMMELARVDSSIATLPLCSRQEDTHEPRAIRCQHGRAIRGARAGSL
jgi:glutaryl-CoA dehydrogenase